MFSNLGLLSFWSRMRMLSWQMPINGSAAWSVAVTVTAYSRWRSRSNFLAVTIIPRVTEITRLFRQLIFTKRRLVSPPQSLCNLTLKWFPLFALKLNFKDRADEEQNRKGKERRGFHEIKRELYLLFILEMILVLASINYHLQVKYKSLFIAKIL